MDTGPRMERLRRRLAESGERALLVTHPANRVYLSGFTGSAGVILVTRDAAWLVTDFRYAEAAQEEAPSCRVVQHGPNDQLAVIGRLLGEAGVRRVACEAAAVSVSRFQAWRAAWPEVEIVPREGLVEALRMVKEPGEIALIRRAMALAEEAFRLILPEVRPGRRERDLALDLEVAMRRSGADAAAFDFIVASGPRSSLPHGGPTERVIEAGDLVTFDFGARYLGYHSDITRTVLAGAAVDPRQREVYETVRAAQAAGLAAVRPGATGAAVDRAAREVIAAAGYAGFFGHGTGHGVGLEIHESPRLAPGREEDVLAAGMVVTVEPGIYIPGWGGVRIEDTVLVTEDGCRSLCATTKELLALMS